MSHLHLTAPARCCAVMLLITALLLAGLPQAAYAQLPTVTPSPVPDPALATPDPAAAAQPGFVPGELLVGVRLGAAGSAGGVSANAADAVTTADAMAAVVGAAGASVASTFDTTGPADTQVVYRLSMQPGQEYAVANQLIGKPGVVYAEPNWYVYTAQDEPTGDGTAAGDGAAADPADSADAAQINVSSGYVVNDPLYATNQWNMQRINAARAWQMLYDQKLFGSPAAVTVAVLDTGIDTTHPDFAGRLLPGYNYITEIVGSDVIINPPMRDGYGHGTHVAGILAAALNNNVGVAGIAPKIKIAPYRVLDDSGSGELDNVATGIISATVAGVQVINMSLAAGFPSNTLADAVTYAASHDVLLVAAAGNTYGAGVQYPAKYPEVIAVAALDYDNHRSSFSSYGPEVEIAAPGGDLYQHPIFSTWSKDARTNNDWKSNCEPSGTLTTAGGAYYCTRSGTSQATPLVAGVAALLRSVNPTLTAADVRALLRDSADPLSEAAQYVGAGKLNAANALRRVLSSSVEVHSSFAITEVEASTLPLTMTVALENPSLEALDWSAVLTTPATVTAAATITPSAWITMTSGTNNAQAGSLAYGEPNYITLLISPTQSVAATYAATLAVTGTRTDGTHVQRALPLTVVVKRTSTDPGLQHTFIPVVYGGSDATTVAAGKLTWLTPAVAASRVTYTLAETGSVGIALPASVTLGGVTYAAARIFADGFVALGANAAELEPLAAFDAAANQCLPAPTYPAQGIYGWWSNLNPAAAGARVSSFSTSDGRLVIEYKDVPAVGATEPYSVSFQIVLGSSGSVGLNYARAPHFTGKPERVTVGIEASDGRFYTLIGCATPAQILGSMPQSGQSYLIRAKDIY